VCVCVVVVRAPECVLLWWSPCRANRCWWAAGPTDFVEDIVVSTQSEHGAYELVGAEVRLTDCSIRIVALSHVAAHSLTHSLTSHPHAHPSSAAVSTPLPAAQNHGDTQRRLCR
jgi:hypothetical protein